MPCKTKPGQSSRESHRMVYAMPPDTPRPPKYNLNCEKTSFCEKVDLYVFELFEPNGFPTPPHIFCRPLASPIIHGKSMGPMGTHGNPWGPMGTHEESWVPGGSTSRGSLGFPSCPSHGLYRGQHGSYRGQKNNKNYRKTEKLTFSQKPFFYKF